MIRGTVLVCLVCIANLLHAGVASSQTWEIDLRLVAIDHDYEGPSSDDWEQIPVGFAIAGRQTWASGAFFGLEISRGSEEHYGAVCGGFIYDPVTQCVPETVSQSGGLVAVFAGMRWRSPLGSKWTIGIAPRGGAGFLWTREHGKNTKRTLSHSPFATLLGVAAEASYGLPQGMALLSSVGADYLRPYSIIEEDGWQPLRNSMPQVSIAVGVAWARQ
jgi:hypothetical protein